MDLLIDAQGVQKEFVGVRVLQNACLKLKPGTVHALCGGNGAGKSTFLNILMGIMRRSGGDILIKGEPVDFERPAQALAAGIAIITQELGPIKDLTVAENIYLGREPRRFGLVIDYSRLNKQAADLLERLHFDIDPTLQMKYLSLAQTQLVEIAKAISCNSDILIMDEPTSAIGEAETKVLFEAIRTLTGYGTGIIYVSHRLTEIFEIADEYTVLRDGSFVETGNIKDIDRPGLVRLILGRDARGEYIRSTEDTVSSSVMFSAKNFSKQGQFKNINVDVNKGEILGLYGLMGAGRSEFLNCLYGSERPDSGEIRINGHSVTIRKPVDALRQGIALVTEDRKETGLVLTMSVRENVSLSSLSQLARLGVIDETRERKSVGKMVDLFRVKAASMDALVKTMSGGNQQKVVFSRCLSTNPRILLCDEPTRGIDEGTKREMYAFLSSFAQEGNCVILVSSEIPEVLGMSDRVVVFRRGRIAGELSRSEADQDRLMHLAS